MHLHRNGLVQSGAGLKQVAEIGPGDSFGSGMAALYSGAGTYTALDVIRHATHTTNLQVNDGILQLFLQQQDIPHQEFPDLSPALSDYHFPHNLLPADPELYREKHRQIKRSLESASGADTVLDYQVSWMDTSAVPDREYDLIFSQAAMEHVSDIHQAYRKMHRMLRTGGIISHQVDFRAHEMTASWDGHFYILPRTWQILAHGRKYPMNRLPLSAHLEALTVAGFRLINLVRQTGTCTHPRLQPAVPGVQFDLDDRATMGALIQAVKE